jgi:propionyl-CoA carboxylase alpha chain
MKKILVANRGEIACRILRACKDAGIQTVAIFSDHDKNALHVSLADEAYSLGGNTPAESYLRQDLILEIATRSECDAVHPGYGFLSENGVFAKEVEARGLIFIGPTGESIERLGDKTAARRLAEEQGVPTVPGTLEPLKDLTEALETAAAVGYPILLKAAAGGGGKGMRVVESEKDLESALRAAQSEADGAFGDDRVYVEKLVLSPRHIEIQILADNHGNGIYLGERECSIQRRHQKVVEESPSPFVTPEMRKQMGEAAISLVLAGGYRNAGTVEFIVDAERNFYFLEVNTRLQVEHPVTELVTGIDLVSEQIRLAAGEELGYTQQEISPQGVAIECRICAEDPGNNFFPSSGVLTEYSLPSGPFVRVENGFRKNDTIPVFYDSLLAKVVTYGPDRKTAIQRMNRSLSECFITGVSTNVDFCTFVMEHKAFQSGDFNTGFIKKYFKPEFLKSRQASDPTVSALVAGMLFRGKKGIKKEERSDETTSNNMTQWAKQRINTYR